MAWHGMTWHLLNALCPTLDLNPTPDAIPAHVGGGFIHVSSSGPNQGSREGAGVAVAAASVVVATAAAAATVAVAGMGTAPGIPAVTATGGGAAAATGAS